MDPLEYIVKDGMMECDKGSTPENFKPTFNTNVKIENILAATIVDAKPIINIPSFKICKVDQKPCIPVTTKNDWKKSFEKKINGEKTLLGESYLKCKKGGKIKFITSGQVPVDKSKGKSKNSKTDKMKEMAGEAARFAVGFVPVLGSGLDAYDSFKEGDWKMGLVNTAFAISDVFTLGGGSVVKGALKGGMKFLGKLFGKKAAKKVASTAVKAKAKTIAAKQAVKEAGKEAAKKLLNLVLAIKKKGGKIVDKATAGLKKIKSKLKGCGDPVDPISGNIFYPYIDFELPGPLPLVWNREYNSGSSFIGLLGRGVSSVFDLRITEFKEQDTIKINLSEGNVLTLSIPEEGKSVYHILAKVEIFKTDDSYKLFDYTKRLWYEYKEIQKQIYVPERIYNEQNFAILFHYTGKHLAQIVDSRGIVLKVKTDYRGFITQISFPTSVENRILVEYEYDEAGNMVAAYDSYNQKTSMEYDSQYRMVKKTDRNGQSFYWEYSNWGKCIHAWGDHGLQEFWFEYQSGKTIVKNSTNYMEVIEYDSQYNILKETDAYGNSKRYEYDEIGFLIKEINEEGWETVHKYDELGNKVKTLLSDGGEYSFVYDNKNRLIQSKDPSGIKNHWIYEENKLIKTVSREQSTIFFYNDKNLISKIRDFRNEETLLEYDESCNLIKTVLPDGKFSQWEYNAFGECIKSINPLGQAQQFEYDRLGRLIKVHLPNSDTLDLKYDAYDSILQVNTLRSKIKYTYTPLGSMLSREEKGIKVNFEYDKQEQLQSITNEKGEKYRFLRNRRGDIIQEVSFDGINKYYRRDKAGKVVQTSYPGGHTLYEYDKGGRIIRVEYQDGSWETFSYDKGGQLIEARNLTSLVRFKRNMRGQVVQEQQGEHILEYVYNEKGDLLKFNSSLGAEISYKRDKYGLVEQIQTEGESPWTAQIKRNMLGLEIERLLPGGIKSSWSYDGNNNPISQKVERIGQRTCLHKNYQWNGSQQLTKIMNELTRGTTVFSYDAFGSLASAQYEDGKMEYKMPDEIGNLFNSHDRSDRKYVAGGKLIQDKKWKYYYDSKGNLTLKTKRNLSAGVIDSVSEKVKPKSEKFSFWIEEQKPGKNYSNWYDEKAEIRKYSKKELKEYDQLRNKEKKKEEAKFLWQPGDWQYEWYASGILQCVTTPEGKKIYFEYDALGRRTSKIVGKKIYRYIWDGNVLLHEWQYNIEERPKLLSNSQGVVFYSGYEPVKDITTWIYEDGSFVPSAKITGDGNYSIISDYIGRPVQAYSKEGEVIWEAEYSIYGKLKVQKGDKDFIPFRQLGQYEDPETGLYYNRFRYYSPETGAYLSKDPIGLAGNNPNLYAYVHDSNTMVDPWGLDPLLVDPSTIFFSQNNIKGTFTNGTSIETVIDAVKANPSIAANFDESIRLMKLEDLPTSVQTKLKNQGAQAGDIFSLDNRRLYVAQQAGAPDINARFVTQADLITEAKLKGEKPINLNKRFSTDDAGRSIKVRCP